MTFAGKPASTASQQCCGAVHREQVNAMLEQARACGADADPCGVLHDAPASLQ
ncbi:hypothetical protein IB259_04785 [Achromobacter sp. ACM04]|uniref:hypothetical protein n=1 Tax=Achromobacter TaxID=222 RepID=UPI0014198B6D|nr:MULTISPECIES: hypothetical protein [Achromobacter]MBD9418551.1 hypothetical protein [Achromobacter sp. ACM04]